jgi:hypothetical protein
LRVDELREMIAKADGGILAHAAKVPKIGTAANIVAV